MSLFETLLVSAKSNSTVIVIAGYPAHNRQA
jgi:hypothetical protein